MSSSAKVKTPRDKIEPLFSYRLIPWLVDRSSLRGKKDFYKRLQKLQRAIYELDTYLESNWDLKDKMLKSKWKKIFATLTKFGIEKKERYNWCQEIFVYQKQEVALRRKKLPTRLDISEFYFYKSCDVKLMRRLLYRADPSLNKLISYTDWMAFDYLTEVNDDVEDVFEDCDVYNCNRFLFSLYARGKSQSGQEYRSFINQIQNEVEKRLDKERNKERRQILKQTIKIALDTKLLLKKRLKSKKLKKISKAKTIGKWKP